MNPKTGFLAVSSLLLLTGCATTSLSMDAPDAPVAFQAHEVALGVAVHETVLTGHLLGDDTAELVVVGTDEHGASRVRLYAFDGDTWMRAIDAPLPDDVQFVDIARVGGRDRLLVYKPGRLSWFEPDTATMHVLVHVTTDCELPESPRIPQVDITHDLNGDGRDDLVVPDSGGFRVLVQRDGSFAPEVQLGPAAAMGSAHRGEQYRYDPWADGRLYAVDDDGDGRLDLVSWDGEHLVVHGQDASGGFGSVTRSFTVDVDFDSDDLDFLAAPREVGYREHDSSLEAVTTGRVLHSLRDHDGDGVPDLAVFALGGRSLWHMHSTYAVHPGTAAAAGVVFASEPSTVLRSEGIPFDVVQQDVDDDGDLDMLLTTIDPDIFRMVGAVLSKSVTLELELYCMDEGTYPARPSAVRKTKADDLAADERNVRFPLVALGDVNGDDRADLLVGRGGQSLLVSPATSDPGVFASRPVRVPVAMPASAEWTWLADVNGDGVRDVVMHHVNEARVGVLMAKPKQ